MPKVPMHLYDMVPIRCRLEEIGVFQGELASHLGVSRQTLNRALGGGGCSRSLALKLADYCEMDLDDLRITADVTEEATS